MTVSPEFQFLPNSHSSRPENIRSLHGAVRMIGHAVTTMEIAAKFFVNFEWKIFFLSETTLISAFLINEISQYVVNG